MFKKVAPMPSRDVEPYLFEIVVHCVVHLNLDNKLFTSPSGPV